MSPSNSDRFGADPKPYYLAIAVLVALEFARRAFLGYVPDDFTAYLSAADTFASGANPYGDAIFEQARYNGKPYNYFPGTLYLIVPLAWVSTSVAVALDWVARCAVLFATLRYLQRRILPDTGLQFVLLVALFHEPLMIDLLFGNSVTYLLGAWALSVWLSEQEHEGPRQMALSAVVGLVMVFKPFWFLPAAYSFYLGRKWKLLGVSLAAIIAVGAASFTLPDTIPTFLAHTQRMREFYYSVDLLNLASPLLPLAALVWAAAALWIERQGDRQWAFLWGCTSIVVWPRLATYSYAMTIPLVLFLVRRWGWTRGLLYSVVLIGPLPWLLRTSSLMPGERLENWVHFVWVSVTAVVVFVMLTSSAKAPEEGAV